MVLRISICERTSVFVSVLQYSLSIGYNYLLLEVATSLSHAQFYKAR